MKKVLGWLFIPLIIIKEIAIIIAKLLICLYSELEESYISISGYIARLLGKY